MLRRGSGLGGQGYLQGADGAKARQSRRTLTVEAGKVSKLRGGPDLGGRVQLQGVGGARAQPAGLEEVRTPEILVQTNREQCY